MLFLNNLLIASLVFCNCIKASLSDFKPISYDLVKPLRALRFSPIFVLGAASGCCFLETTLVADSLAFPQKT